MLDRSNRQVFVRVYCIPPYVTILPELFTRDYVQTQVQSALKIIEMVLISKVIFTSRGAKLFTNKTLDKIVV